MERESMVFYKSFYEVIKGMVKPDGSPDPDRQLNAFYMLMEYGYFKNLPDEASFIREDGRTDEATKALFILARPLIDKNQKKFEDGKKGGRPPTLGKKPGDALPTSQDIPSGSLYIPPDVADELIRRSRKGGE